MQKKGLTNFTTIHVVKTTNEQKALRKIGIENNFFHLINSIYGNQKQKENQNQKSQS